MAEPERTFLWTIGVYVHHTNWGRVRFHAGDPVPVMEFVSMVVEWFHVHQQYIVLI